MAREKRTRFAPSPSGDLHIGGARTALFNFLLAKKIGGLFLFRVEDTDQNRSSTDSIDNIASALKWLGINWDEGPGMPGKWYQSQRIDIYKDHANMLIDSGMAYPCFCPNEKTGDDIPAHYNRRCRLIPRNEAASMMRDVPYCIRLKNPDKPIGISDLVYGDININTSTFEDIVLIRTNGYPMYNFSCVVDDYMMGVTHVVRGNEHIPNTPKQILIYDALGKDHPRFAHLPLILDNVTKKKMSKRDGGVSVLGYMKDGLSSMSVMFYIATLGWNPKNIKDFTIDELAKKFDLKDVKKTAAYHDKSRLIKLDKDLKGKFK